MTNFTDVSTLNTAFGNLKGDNKNPDWAKASRQLQLIQEEMAELVSGIENSDIHEVRDAIADVLVTTYGMAHVLGIDADADMATVQASNMSKLCKTEQEIADTLAFYREEKGLEVYSGGELPCAWVKSANDQTGTDGKFYPAHKFLKNTQWFEPSFD